ncbi:MAG: Uma2 family endonuclease [Alkalinema sp. CAN_BIN05]|nr:Uma2 family endonuclease [Alkalinema sp. CAN_BIN05]
MLKYLEPLDWLPTAEDLPESDEKPVDSELQRLLADLLRNMLAGIFKGRTDWFFGIDMGVYYSPDEPAIAPDGFLSIGVKSVKTKGLRTSYVLWEDDGVIPQFILEVVSKSYRGEYTTKKDLYQNLGVLYYVVYNPIRRRKNTLEVYRLVQGQYVPVIGNPVWMPEIGLGIGKDEYTHQDRDREWLFWYNEKGDRYLTPDEQIDEKQQQVQQAKQQAKLIQEELDQEKVRSQKFADRLHQLGINLDEL